MGVVAGGLEFGTLFSKVRRGVARVALAELGDKKGDNESNASDWQFVVVVSKVRAEGEPGTLDLSPGDLRFILASLASI